MWLHRLGDSAIYVGTLRQRDFLPAAPRLSAPSEHRRAGNYRLALAVGQNRGILSDIARSGGSEKNGCLLGRACQVVRRAGRLDHGPRLAPTAEFAAGCQQASSI